MGFIIRWFAGLPRPRALQQMGVLRVVRSPRPAEKSYANKTVVQKVDDQRSRLAIRYWI